MTRNGAKEEESRRETLNKLTWIRVLEECCVFAGWVYVVVIACVEES